MLFFVYTFYFGLFCRYRRLCYLLSDGVRPITNRHMALLNVYCPEMYFYSRKTITEYQGVLLIKSRLMESVFKGSLSGKHHGDLRFSFVAGLDSFKIPQ